jgi:ABC-type Fe3+/spermidine/putrescine transport system ATPase subunit
VSCLLGALPLRATGAGVTGAVGGGAGKVIVRPERIALAPTDLLSSAGAPPSGDNVFHGLVDRVVYLGPTTHVVLRLADGQTLLVAVPNTGEPLSSPFAVGTPVQASFPPEAARLLPGEPVDDDPSLALPDQRASAAARPS